MYEVKVEMVAKGTVRIGSGLERHPAERVRYTHPDGRKVFVNNMTCKCGCKGRQTSQVFEKDTIQTCKG